MSIIVPAGESILSSIVGAYKVLNSVNSFLQMKGEMPFYKIDLVGITDSTSLYGGAFSVTPTRMIEDIEKTDLIIITTVNGDMAKELKTNAPFIPWIREQHFKHGAEVASLCMGAFLLAETGLLDGKTCATHWMGHEAFRERYPQIELAPKEIITDDKGIYTIGGAYSFLNLLLHIAEKQVGREAAIWVSKLLEIEFDRFDQGRFIIFNGQKDHKDESIRTAQEYIETNYKEKLSVEQLAEKVAISRRNFVRRFKKATANTPIEYIQRVKIEAAKKQLESSLSTIQEVMCSVGYNDDKAFRNTFRKFTGLTPLEYKSRYNREQQYN